MRYFDFYAEGAVVLVLLDKCMFTRSIVRRGGRFLLRSGGHRTRHTAPQPEPDVHRLLACGDWNRDCSRSDHDPELSARFCRNCHVRCDLCHCPLQPALTLNVKDRYESCTVRTSSVVVSITCWSSVLEELVLRFWRAGR